MTLIRAATSPTLFAGLAVVVAGAGIWNLPSPGHDVVRQLDREFRQLSLHLPPSGVIGYLDPPRTADNAVESERTFYAMQYSLAPHVIVRSFEPEFVIVPRDHASDGDRRLAGLFVYGTTPAGHRVFRRLVP